MKHSVIQSIPLRVLAVVLTLAASFATAQAQTDGSATRHADGETPAVADSATKATLDATAPSLYFAPMGIALPYGLGGYGLGGLSPLSSDIDGSAWRLHEGFNAQFGLSLSAGLGKHAMKGVGFGQNAAFAYVAPITPKLWVAAGIFASNLDWGSWRRTDVGIGGMMAYDVSERVNLYVYGSKSFVPRAGDFSFRHDPFPIFLEQPRERIGAAAEFKVGNNAMIGVSVEHRRY